MAARRKPYWVIGTFLRTYATGRTLQEAKRRAAFKVPAQVKVNFIKRLRKGAYEFHGTYMLRQPIAERRKAKRIRWIKVK